MMGSAASIALEDYDASTLANAEASHKNSINLQNLRSHVQSEIIDNSESEALIKAVSFIKSLPIFPA